jgi:glycosyltransferase involved in cell wall biosynthesis
MKNIDTQNNNAIHAMILTFNEELHLSRCIESILKYCTTITVIDSGSTDNTLEIAKRYGCCVV